MGAKAKFGAVVFAVGLVIAGFTLAPAPAGAAVGSWSVYGCNFNGQNSYAGAGYRIAVARTWSNCSTVDVKMRWVDQWGTWHTASTWDVDGDIGISQGSAWGLAYSNHDVYVQNNWWGVTMYCC